MAKKKYDKDHSKHIYDTPDKPKTLTKKQKALIVRLMETDYESSFQWNEGQLEGGWERILSHPELQGLTLYEVELAKRKDIQWESEVLRAYARRIATDTFQEELQLAFNPHIRDDIRFKYLARVQDQVSKTLDATDASDKILMSPEVKADLNISVKVEGPVLGVNLETTTEEDIEIKDAKSKNRKS